MKIYQLLTLPEILQPDSLYFILNGDYAESYLTDNSGVAKLIGNSSMVTELGISTLAELLDVTTYDLTTVNAPLVNALAGKSATGHTHAGVYDPAGSAAAAQAAAIQRANHTGEQAISTVTGLQTAIDGKSSTAHTHSNAEINTAIAASPATSATAMGLGTANTPTFAGLKTTGYVGVGTTSPAATIEILSTTASSDTPGTNLITRWTPDAGKNQGMGLRYSADKSQFCLDRLYSTAWSNVMTWRRDTGNVGIGTTSPSDKLEIAGIGTGQYVKFNVAAPYDGDATTKHTKVAISSSNTADSQAVISFQARDSSNQWRNADFALDEGALCFRLPSGTNIAPSSADTRLTIKSTGNVGIGTAAPDAELHVKKAGTDGAYNLVARFEAGGNLNNTGSSILINHSANRGLLIEAGRENGDVGIAHLGILNSAGSNSRVLTLKQEGNVGIGTTSPAEKLEVAGNIRVSSLVESLSADQVIGKVEFYKTDVSTGGAGVPAYIQARTSNSGGDFSMDFVTGSVSAPVTSLSLSALGNVGIGTTAPSAKLQVKADSATLGGEIKITNDLSTATIGQSAALSFGREYDDRTVRLSSVSTGSYGVYPDFVVTANKNASGASHTELLRVKNNGNVGIGTAAPAKMIHLLSDTTPTIRIEDRSFNNYLDIGHGDNYATFDIPSSSNAYWFRADSNIRFVIQKGGNVGIGTTSPNRLLHVAGQTAITDSNDTCSFLFIPNPSLNSIFSRAGNATTTAVPLGIFMGGTERFRMDLVGNVGIGTPAPTEKLDVVGNIKASGTVKTGSQTVSVATASSSATAVAAGAGAMTYISNESGGATIAFSDGIVWRRVSDRAAIS
tara:strand:- start:1739 stop:4273 length:2535 start_codon:yes stop_codon:yes gene_type:complete